MPEPEYQVLQLSPDDVIEIKHGSLRVSKLQKAVNQALQRLEPQFVQELDRTLQSMGITPSISGNGTWMITDSQAQQGLAMQYLRVQGGSWDHGLINLSIQIQACNFLDFLQVKVTKLLEKYETVETQQQLLYLIDSIHTLLNSSANQPDPDLTLKSAYDNISGLKNVISRRKADEVTLEEILDSKARVLEILRGVGCTIPESNVQSSTLSVTESPLDDIRQSLDQ